MNAVLVDTSVWRGYFMGRAAARPLRVLLEEDGLVLVHSLVIGELVLGGLSLQQERLLAQLPSAQRVPSDEVLTLIRRRRLSRKGIGWVDAELIAASLVSNALLWSLDAALVRVANNLGLGFDPRTARGVSG
jgi:predicted nucleic acid-binding protein